MPKICHELQLSGSDNISDISKHKNVTVWIKLFRFPALIYSFQAQKHKSMLSQKASSQLSLNNKSFSQLLNTQCSQWGISGKILRPLPQTTATLSQKQLLQQGRTTLTMAHGVWCNLIHIKTAKMHYRVSDDALEHEH